MNDGLAGTAAGAHGGESMFSLLAAAHALEAKLESALERSGLSMAKFSVLDALVSAGGPVSLSELAAQLSCVRSNMTQLVDRLEADGLVQRVPCPNDRRLVKAEITAAGRERQVQGAAEIAAIQGEFAAKVPAADRAALDRLARAFD